MPDQELTYLPVDLLWDYREFKRDEKPAPKVPFFNMYNVDEVTEYVRTHGLEPVELSILGEKALLTDGNHRIAAAKKLGYQNIPVHVMVYSGKGEETFYHHTLERFKLISTELQHHVSSLQLFRK